MAFLGKKFELKNNLDMKRDENKRDERLLYVALTRNSKVSIAYSSTGFKQ